MQREDVSMDGPFRSFEELKAAKLQYEKATNCRYNNQGSTSIEHYIKRCKNKLINGALVYQTLNLVCHKYGVYQPRGTGERQRTGQQTNCPSYFRYNASPDGSCLILKTKCEDHNHEV